MGRRQGRQPYITFGYHRRPPAMPRAAAPGPAPGFMRLTPDSRAPAKADPSARAGVVVVVGRCWPYLGAGLPLSWP